MRSVRVAERLALPTSDHGVAGSNPTGGEILPEPKRRFIAQSLSCSPFHRLEMTEILLKVRKTLTHPSISIQCLFMKQQEQTIETILDIFLHWSLFVVKMPFTITFYRIFFFFAQKFQRRSSNISSTCTRFHV